jgi:hypothetical protein
MVKKYPPLFRSWHGPVAEISLTRPEDVEVSGCLLTINVCINNFGRGSVSELLSSSNVGTRNRMQNPIIKIIIAHI